MRVILMLFLTMFIVACGSDPGTGTQVREAEKVSVWVDSTQWSSTDRQLNPLVNAYFDLKNALVEWDTAGANAASFQMINRGNMLVKDSSVAADIRQQVGSLCAEAEGLRAEPDITEKRRAFHMMSQILMPLLQQQSFRAQPVYQQLCPMAFNDDESAFWLSNQREIINPYLGKKHPKYASGMLHCGELVDSLFAGNQQR